MHLQHRVAGARDDQRSWVDPHRLLSGGGVEEDDLGAPGPSLLGRSAPGRTAADHDDVGMDVRCAGPGARAGRRRDRRMVELALDDRALASRHLTRPYVCDAVDGGDAARAVARQAEAASVARVDLRAQQGERQRVALAGIDLDPVDDDPHGPNPRYSRGPMRGRRLGG